MKRTKMPFAVEEPSPSPDGDPLLPLREEVERLRQWSMCDHKDRTGGNDYLLCNTCNFMWDYRRETAQQALFTRYHAFALSASQRAEEADRQLKALQTAATAVLSEVECNDWQRHEAGPCDACVSLKLLREALQAVAKAREAQGSNAVPTLPDGESKEQPLSAAEARLEEAKRRSAMRIEECRIANGETR